MKEITQYIAILARVMNNKRFGVFAVFALISFGFGRLVYLHAIKLRGKNYVLVGRAGVGKSSLVNAIRGLEDEDERSIPVHSWKSTERVEKYTLRNGEYLWDVIEKKHTSFFKTHHFSSFECFVMVIYGSLCEFDIKEAKRALPHVKVIFVRSKLDQDATSINKTIKNMNEAYQMAYQTIHEDINNQLKENNLEESQVFVVSSLGLLEPTMRFGDEKLLLELFSKY